MRQIQRVTLVAKTDRPIGRFESALLLKRNQTNQYHERRYTARKQSADVPFSDDKLNNEYRQSASQ